MTHIIILCYNKIRMSCRCIQAVLDAGYPGSQISIIDNGSTPDFAQEIGATFPNIKIHPLPQNKGFAGGFTEGLRQHFSHSTKTLSSSVLFLTNDTQIKAGCVEACENAARENNACIVAPCLLFRKDTNRIDSIGARFDRFTGTLHHLSEENLPPILTPDEYIPGTAFWITRDAFDKLGGTDESFVMYWEDADLCFRAHQMGIPMVRSYEARIQHGVGQTCHKKPIYTTFYYQRNRIRFCKKWLTEAQWEQVKPTILKDLDTMENRAQEKNDIQRLSYLKDIRSELEFGS